MTYKELLENTYSLGLNKKVQKKFDKVDAIENISEYVDLGLPSGNLWCKYNYGATSEEDFGDLYNYEEMISLDLKDYLRLPTHSDFVELKNNCDIKGFSINGINGRLLVSRINGNQIFLPAGGIVIDINGDLVGRNKNGDYWTSTKDTTPGFGGVRTIIFHNTCVFGFSSTGQENKLSVRCIANKKVNESNLGLASKVKAKHDDIDAIDNISDYVDLGLPSGNLWAKCNVGAISEEEYGDYYSYKDIKSFAKGNIRVPDNTDWTELKRYCTITFETLGDGSKGMKFTSKSDPSKYILLPSAGYDDTNWLNDPNYNCDKGNEGYYMLRNIYGYVYNFNGNINFYTFSTCSTFDTSKFSVRLIEYPEKKKKTKKIEESSHLGLNKKVQNKFNDINAIDNISDYVDLGLPSGNLWAKCNVGSDEIQDYGDYMSYDEAVERGLGDSMPTEEDWEELKANCNFCYTEYYAGEGNGLLLSSKKDKSKEIFLPAGGHQYETVKKVFGDGVSGNYLINGMKGLIKCFSMNSSSISTIIYDDRNVKCLARLVNRRKN